MNKRIKMSIVVLSLLLIVMSVGYASYSMVLYISGSSAVQTANWSVIFDTIGNGIVDTNYTMATPSQSPVIDSSKHNINFAVDLKVSQMYQFTVDVKNEGTMDASLDSFSITVDGTTYNTNTWSNNYLNYETIWSDTGDSFGKGDIIPAGVSRNITVTVKYSQPTNSADLPSSDENHTFGLNLNWVQNNYLTTTTTTTTTGAKN
jgi:hypothetical protein